MPQKTSSSTPSPRQRMAGPERREQIVRAAREVFISQGLGGSRTREIALAAGVNEALLYQHFDSKDELFRAAVREPLEAVAQRLEQVAAFPPPDPEASRDEIRARAKDFAVDLVESMVEIAPLLGVMVFSGDAAASENFKTAVEPIVTQVSAIAQANAGWWEHNEYNPDLITRFMFGAVWFEVMHARLTQRDFNVDSLTDELVALFESGLGLG